MFSVESKSSTSYSFIDQEQVYYQFRPRWPHHFALAALEKLGIHYDEEKKRWMGLTSDHTASIIVSVGCGAGSDAEAFLKLGCIVYGVEPNAEFRQLACYTLDRKYPKQFISVAGDAHHLNLPATLKADLIVCAQALHTFRSDVLQMNSSEGLARRSFNAILPNDDANQISIWYYNLDPLLHPVPDLDQRLRKVSHSYAISKTPCLDAPFFEPRQFQHYINLERMAISTSQPVDQQRLSFENVKQWVKSFSFYPKKNREEETRVLQELADWFKLHQNKQGEIELNYIGYIAQGPLRKTPHFECAKEERLPPVPAPINRSQRCLERDKNNSNFWPAPTPVMRLQSKL